MLSCDATLSADEDLMVEQGTESSTTVGRCVHVGTVSEGDYGDGALHTFLVTRERRMIRIFWNDKVDKMRHGNTQLLSVGSQGEVYRKVIRALEAWTSST